MAKKPNPSLVRPSMASTVTGSLKSHAKRIRTHAIRLGWKSVRTRRRRLGALWTSSVGGNGGGGSARIRRGKGR